MDSPQKKTTVIYDDTCSTCNVAKLMGEKMDTHGNLEFVGMHTEEGKRVVAERGLDMEKSAYAIKVDGTVAARAQMVHTVLQTSGFIGKALGKVVSLLPERAADRMYDLASKHRVHRH